MLVEEVAGGELGSPRLLLCLHARCLPYLPACLPLGVHLLQTLGVGWEEDRGLLLTFPCIL